MGGDAMPYETILYEKKGPVLTITLNRPDTLNAINPQMTAELHAALDQADADAETRAIILTCAGRGFSAGFDLARRPGRRSSLGAAGAHRARSRAVGALQQGGHVLRAAGDGPRGRHADERPAVEHGPRLVQRAARRADRGDADRRVEGVPGSARRRLPSRALRAQIGAEALR